MAEDNQAVPGFDPFMKFWADMTGRMAASGVTAPTGAPDMMAQMRKTFFGAMAEYADDYMRSEQFLSAMKQNMDNALAFKQQINQFLTSTLQSSQMPSRSDTDHIVLLVRGMESRIVEKLDDLSARVDQLEAQRNGSAKKPTGKDKPQHKKSGRSQR